MNTSTPETKAWAKQNLFDFMDILEECGIVAWLDGGTLLGAYRDGDFCDGDEDDIDIFTWSRPDIDEKIREVMGLAETRGFKVHRHWKGDRRAPGMAQEVAFYREHTGRMKIDFNVFERKGSMAWGLAYVGKDEGIPQVVPARFYDQMENIVFLGRIFNAPYNVERYLTHRYGDWRTPIHRTAYRYDNPDQLRALKPGFKFWK